MNAPDPHDLARFIAAQTADYAAALAEISAGRKQSHWMWYIFPQFQGWGSARCRNGMRSAAPRRRGLIWRIRCWGRGWCGVA
jgi:uncharacterized protein (DUF1810 family)